jgi:hypothetical protein
MAENGGKSSEYEKLVKCLFGSISFVLLSLQAFASKMFEISTLLFILNGACQVNENQCIKIKCLYM